MAGRHADASVRPHARRQPRRLPVIPIVAVVALALVAGSAYFVFRPGTAAGRSSAGPCTSGVAITVVTAPSIGPAVRAVADHWSQSQPNLGGICPTVNVATESSAAEQATLAQPNVTVPDVWVPDSSVWVQQLQVATDGEDSPARSLWVYPAVATSPLVLAGPKGSGSASTPPPTWTAALAQPHVALTDPTTDTAGLLTLLTAQSLLDSSSGQPSRDLVSTLVRLSSPRLRSAGSGFAGLRSHPSTAATFPTSEQKVAATTAQSGDLAVTTVHPTGAALALDFPVAQFSRPGGDPAQRLVATSFVTQLRSAYAQSVYAKAGLRGPAGRPLAAGATSGATTGATTAATSGATTAAATAPTPATTNAADVTNTPVATPSGADVADALRVWQAARRGNRTLAVIDLSGSMSQAAGGGQSKIRFAARAARAAVDFFPDSSSLGLWGFSVDRAPHRDWQELVPLGPLGGQVSGGSRRQALLDATGRLPEQTGGLTGLYATTLAAYEKVRSGYDPDSLDSVVVLTDGSNSDHRGIDLAELLSRLRSETSTSRPLPIITIAIGPNADVHTLKRISAATKGHTYTVTDPSDIRSAFLDAVISAS